MKQLMLLLIYSTFASPLFSQKFTIGIENGINFSNARQSSGTTHYAAEPGPVNGFLARYQPVHWLVLQSGINHTSCYFNQSSYNYYPDYFRHIASSYSYASIMPPANYYNTGKYSFLRFPLLAKLKTQGRLSTEFGGGAFYAILTNDEYRGKDKAIQTEQYQNEPDPQLNDWGWILTGSVNYSINEHWGIFIAGQITTGHEKYLKEVEGRLGTTEFTFGVEYKLFGNKSITTGLDSTGSKINIIPHAGVNISSTHSTENKDEYHSVTGLSAGISLNFSLAPNVSFLTGTWFEQKGYGLNYNGSNSIIYLPPIESENQNTPATKSEVNLDYLTFPLMFEFSFGKKLRSNISVGTYYSWLQNAYSQGERIATYDYGQGYQVSKNYFCENQEQWFKNSDSGFMLGYRFEVPVCSWGNIFIAANQSLGAVDILKDIEKLQTLPQFSIEDKMYNRSTTVMMGFTIPLTQK